MKLLIELYGFDKAFEAVSSIRKEVKGMHDDYYIRNAIRILDK